MPDTLVTNMLGKDTPRSMKNRRYRACAHTVPENTGTSARRDAMLLHVNGARVVLSSHLRDRPWGASRSGVGLSYAGDLTHSGPYRSHVVLVSLATRCVYPCCPSNQAVSMGALRDDPAQGLNTGTKRARRDAERSQPPDRMPRGVGVSRIYGCPSDGETASLPG